VKRKLLILAAVIVVPLFCATFSGAMWLIQVPVRLAIGWVPFVIDAGGRVRWDVVSILAAVVASALFAFGVHRLGTWLRPQWSRRTSLATSALLGLGFVASMASMGIAHQAAWLFSSNEPFFTSSWDRRRGSGALSLCKQLFTEFRSAEGEEPRSKTFARAVERQTEWLVIPGGAEDFLFLPVDPQQRLEGVAYACSDKGDLIEPLTPAQWSARFKDLSLSAYAALDAARPDAGTERK
jgi:hypothetical protein